MAKAMLARTSPSYPGFVDTLEEGGYGGAMQRVRVYYGHDSITCSSLLPRYTTLLCENE